MTRVGMIGICFESFLLSLRFIEVVCLLSVIHVFLALYPLTVLPTKTHPAQSHHIIQDRNFVNALQSRQRCAIGLEPPQLRDF